MISKILILRQLNNLFWFLRFVKLWYLTYKLLVLTLLWVSIQILNTTVGFENEDIHHLIIFRFAFRLEGFALLDEPLHQGSYLHDACAG